MSLEAMTWALTKAPATDATKVLILLALANQAKSDGTAAWPGVKLIAEQARCSARTVQRHLRELEADGFLRPGDQRLVAHYRSDKRPVVYDLNLALVRPEAPESGATDRRPVEAVGDERGDTGGRSGATESTERGDIALSPNPSLTRPIDPSERPAGRSRVDDPIPLFPSAVPDPPPPPPVEKKARRRDPLFDAIVEACSIDLASLTDSAKGNVGRVRRELAAVGATADDIRARAEIYRTRFRGADLTANALAKHWPSLTPPPAPSRDTWLAAR